MLFQDMPKDISYKKSIASARHEVAFVLMAIPAVKTAMDSRSTPDPIRRVGLRPNLSRKLSKFAWSVSLYHQ